MTAGSVRAGWFRRLPAAPGVTARLVAGAANLGAALRLPGPDAPLLIHRTLYADLGPVGANLPRALGRRRLAPINAGAVLHSP
ncbi:MAG: hypothetical protein AAF360_09075 [Pseudomonadota bacterium]